MTDIVNATLEIWTSNSWRRFCFGGRDSGQSACEPIVLRDGHPDLHFPGGPEGPVARRFLATWNVCVGVPTETLEAISTGKAEHSLNVYRNLFREIGTTVQTLAKLYDAVQRGDFDIVGVERSEEAQAAIALLTKRGAKFDEFNRRLGAVDKHGNQTEPDTLAHAYPAEGSPT